MGALDLVAAIAAAIIAASVLLLAHGRHGDDRGGPRAELVRYVGVAGLSALVCAVMNVLEIAGGGTVAAAVGNATHVFAPAMVWAAARRLNAREVVGAVSAGAGAILMLALTFVLSLDDATLVKTAGVAAFCVLAAAELRRAPLRGLVGSVVLAVTLGLYALFTVTRLAIAAVFGMHSEMWEAFATAQITAFVSAPVIALMGVGAVRLGRQLDDDPAPGTRAYDRGALRGEAVRLLADHGILTAVTVRLPEIELIRAAHTSEHADTVMSTLQDAVAAVVVDPAVRVGAVPDGAVGAPARDTVIALVPTPRAGDIDEEVRRAFTARLPRIGYDDTPDLLFTHHPVPDVAALSRLMDARRLRPSPLPFDDV